ncbi:hypothetical protein KJ570_04005 [Patescibacteria group bacterium]|nr:hypothetical protein [Patescibacteria group bacterium]MBU2036311.1 hypothetical protein [Patescibacteria group bacterium]
MEVPRHWRLQKTRYRLVGDRCLVCHIPTFPPKDVCNECNTGDLLNFKKASGTIYIAKEKLTPNILEPSEKVQG